VLFGARDDLPAVGDQPVAVAAIHAIEFLDGIEVGQVLAIDDDIVPAHHPRNAVDAEADSLIKADGQVEQGQGQDHAVDDRRGEYRQRTRMAQVAAQAGAIPTQRLHLAGQARAPFLQGPAQAFALFVDALLQLTAQGLDLSLQTPDFFVHARSPDESGAMIPSGGFLLTFPFAP